MSGRRFLDALTILNATRNVASKHISLQKQHLDVRTRTSSLTKGVKVQSDRIALAIKAAADLAQKFDDSPSNAASQESKAETTESPTSQGMVDPVDRKKPHIPSSGLDQESRNGTSPLKSVQSEPWNAKSHSADSKPLSMGENGEAISGNNEIAQPLESEKRRETLGSDELSAEMVNQLFRSRKVSESLLRNRYGAKSNTNGSSIGERPPAAEAGLLNDTASTTGPNIVSSATTLESTTRTPDQPKIESVGVGLEEPGGMESLPRSEYKMVESRVPSSRIGRLWEYGGLATSMAFGIMGEGFRRATGSNDASEGSMLLSPANIERLVAKLSKMRGAALKLGQMLSFQDSKTLPSTIQEVLQRVQDRANYMPALQRNKVLTDNLGPQWRDLFDTFDEVPMAAASIGQVHAATLKGSGQKVAVKVQYPGVSSSIDSDLNNLSILLTASRLLPKGLYLDKTIANARTELTWECDYIREADCGRKFKELLQDEQSTFVVPEIFPQASGKQVLTMEYLDGIAVTKIKNFTQTQRDWIGSQILRLCFREICEFRYMQTDPNWTNFLYNAKTNRLELLDFGASRAYPASFITTYVQVLVAACRNDREALRDLSIKLGYLTGFESQAMVNAHIESILTLAEPFAQNAPETYDFSDQTITDRVRELIPLMLRERLAPPPEETYSLHRKLSGAFLLCARLGSRVPARKIFEDAVDKMSWEEDIKEEGAPAASQSQF